MVIQEARVASIIDEIIKMLKNGELLEVSIAARQLQRSVRTIYDWLDTGKIQEVRIGKRRYVIKKSLENFLKQNIEG